MQGHPGESSPIGVARHKTSPESLRAMVEFEGFFTPCPNCWAFRSSRDALLNYWDCDTGAAHCSACVVGLPGQTLVQVRRSSYHDVVKVSEISKHMDLAEVQLYIINGAKVVFLRRRPQPKAPRGTSSNYTCSICARHLQDNNSYCSLQCKMEGTTGEVFQPGTPMGFLPVVIQASSPPNYSDLQPLEEQKIGRPPSAGASPHRRKCQPARSFLM